VPAALEHAKQLGRDFAQRGENLKSTHPQLMIQNTKKSYIKTPRRSQSLEKVGRPMLEIRDVGGKFLDLNDSVKRISIARKQTAGRLKGPQRRSKRHKGREKRHEDRTRERHERRKAELQS